MRTLARVLAVPALMAVPFTAITGVGQFTGAHSHTMASTAVPAGDGTVGGQAGQPGTAVLAGDGTAGGQA